MSFTIFLPIIINGHWFVYYQSKIYRIKQIKKWKQLYFNDWSKEHYKNKKDIRTYETKMQNKFFLLFFMTLFVIIFLVTKVLLHRFRLQGRLYFYLWFFTMIFWQRLGSYSAKVIKIKRNCTNQLLSDKQIEIKIYKDFKGPAKWKFQKRFSQKKNSFGFNQGLFTIKPK